jgi:predicted Zn-dependent protease
MYGDDPRQGVVEGNRFIHPDFRLAFDAPKGFVLSNAADKVSISGQSGQGELRTGAYNGDLDSYVRSAFTALTDNGQAQVPVSTIERTTLNGMNVAYSQARVASGGSQLDVVVFAYEVSRDRAFHFVTIAPAGRAAVFEPMYRSLRRISASEAAAVRPRRLDIYTVRPGDTVQSVADRMAYANARLDRFLVLNGLDARAQLSPGQKVKLVVY